MPMTFQNYGECHLKKYSTDRKKSSEMAKIKYTQVKSEIGSTERQKKTLEALGLRKMNRVVEVDATPQILGMINKVKHLVKVIK